MDPLSPTQEFTRRNVTRPDGASDRTVALETLIRSSLDELRHHGEHPRPPVEALLFVGNWNDSLPRLLIYDQVLEPVDKIVWAVIRTRADPQRGTAFPSYATIGRLANVGSEATVSRALAILRVTRWLTLCGRARDTHGRFRGNVYALHDEPLPLVDTLYLDSGYMAFTDQATNHHHARVALVAASVIRSLELDVADGADVVATPEPLSQRVAAQQAAADYPVLINGNSTENVDATDPPSVYGVRSRLRQQLRQQLVQPSASIDLLQNLKSVEQPLRPQNSKSDDHLQNMKTAQPQHLGHQNLQPQILSPVVVVSSSSSESTTTTTTQNFAHPDRLPTARTRESLSAAAQFSPVDAVGDLRWPILLTNNHRYLAAIQLREIPVNLRQTVLDILDQRLRAVERGAERLHYGPLAYLKTLCAKALAGQLVIPKADTAAVIASPASAETAHDEARIAKLRANLHVAKCDRAHWDRLLTLEPREDRQGPILNLIEHAAAEVTRLEAEMAALGR